MMRFEELKQLVREGRVGVAVHSGRVRPGDVFVALKGVKENGARFIPDALARGAAYVVATGRANWPAHAEAELVRHPDPNAALGELALARFSTRVLPFPLVGITGTNGKTTVTYLVEHLFKSVGSKVGVIGTINYRWPGFSLDAPLTTPDCWQLHDLLSNMAKSGVDLGVMEVSSHALAQNRVAGLGFDVAVLTNLTQDHLDYHGDMRSYFEAKAALFRKCPPENKLGIINWDDSYGRILLANHSPAIGYGILEPSPREEEDVAGLKGDILESSAKGLTLRMTWKGESWEFTSMLVGMHNAYNLLAAQAVGLARGLGPRQFRSLASFPGVPGRLERVRNSRGLNVFVDYAHTPDALENVLSAVGGLGAERLVVVFGCGGDRDRTKRPLMGGAVARHADLAVLTSDNPRHEAPEAIMEDVSPGLSDCREMVAEPDRRKAIRMALNRLGPEDVLVVAGKGHETYQEIGDERRPFSDKETILELLGENEPA